ncbi:hypothetical protein QBC46DRAFT_100560 [Diplogelasinospora grovesii]|uniref:Uncharacterized protein n=1 Tax=Diplogelasinospora grovesii TaxID=303347 RepID=A0AAN6NA00_9PEZI|nr:hypothetical protein QBC46DRAFT_100560 [Diplogelasinospora grovesii]
MPSLWKTGSTAARAKPGQKSIRGTISGPIPIPSVVDDGEFPIRTPGSRIATVTANNDDEFPIRRPGTGIASPVPPPEEPEMEPVLQPESHPELQQQQIEEAQHEDDSTPEQELEQELEQQPLQPPPMPSAAVSGESSQVDVTQDIQPEIPPAPADPPPPAPAPAPVAAPAPPQPGSTPSSIVERRPASRTPPQRGSPPRNSPPRRSSPPTTSPARVRTSPPVVLKRATHHPTESTARYSTISNAPSRQDASGPQRKKSTLRSALGRLFGRGGKKKQANGGSTLREDVSAEASGRDSGALPSGPSPHRSDPVTPIRSKETEPKRSASLPITEYDRPLRSHSIGPDDIIAIESARTSIQAEAAAAAAAAAGSGPPDTIGGGGGRTRAATTSSSSRLHYYHLQQPRMRDSEWGAGLSPRPASTHGRSGSRLAGGAAALVPGSSVQGNSGAGAGGGQGSEDPNEIGRAITSDSGNGVGGGAAGRRRSRSLSGLEDAVGARSFGAVRRRSDEIRYWRESYDPGFMSPLSSVAPQDDDDRGDNSSLPESPAVEKPPKTPPQPFNFAALSNQHMIGMKITQAAHSIDPRIGNLEARTSKLERVVDQLCHSVPGFKSPLGLGEPSSSQGRSKQQQQQPQPEMFTHPFMTTGTVPPSIPAMYQPSPKASGVSLPVDDETDSVSQMSFGEAPTYIGSLHPPSSSATQPQSLTSTAPVPPIVISPLHRPTSNSTVRGATSLPTLGGRNGSHSSSAGSHEDPYASLSAQLETERAARQALEAQVKKLSERLNALSSTMFAMLRDPASSRSKSQERLLLQPLPPVSPYARPQPSTNPLKALSVFEDDDDDNDEKGEGEKVDADADADAEGSDNFQTPREEKGTPFPTAYGAFGEELIPEYEEDDDDRDGNGEEGGNEEDPKRKKAARTLSLSQLTYGKGVRGQI